MRWHIWDLPALHNGIKKEEKDKIKKAVDEARRKRAKRIGTFTQLLKIKLVEKSLPTFDQIIEELKTKTFAPIEARVVSKVLERYRNKRRHVDELSVALFRLLGSSELSVGTKLARDEFVGLCSCFLLFG